ncbi:MAG: response regulator [Thermodesulfobacteriota bacterium]
MSLGEMPPRVVLVDDEAVLVSLFSRYLGRTYQVERFCSSSEALRYLQSNSAEILICDLIMPQLNGLDLAHEARQLHPGIKVILISGLTPDRWPPGLDTSMRDVDAFLGKPVSLASLGECCARLLQTDPPDNDRHAKKDKAPAWECRSLALRA